MRPTPRRLLGAIPVTGRNIIANGLGRGWSMLMSFVFVPFYLHLLGVEAYGVIGFFASLAALFSFLDLGLTTTLNRELARRAAVPEERATMRSVVHTLEMVYSGIGIGVGLVIVALADPIARYWLNAQALPGIEIINAIRMMGVVIAFEWPTSLYAGGLAGMQRQVIGNVLSAGTMTARGVGAILVLLFIHRSVTAYFIWQVVVSASGMVLTRWILLAGVPAGAARFDTQILRTVWRFAAGMTGLALLTIVLMQADKVVLSAALPLSEYAHYLLAYSLAGAAGFMAIPIFNAVFPRFTELFAAGDQQALRAIYHRQARILSAVVAPTVLVVVLFPHELMLFWTRDAKLAESVAPLGRMLALGTAMNSVMLIPYALTLACGKPIYSLISNAVGAIVIVPLVLVLATHAGSYGASFAWPLLNLGYVLILAPIILRDLLPGAAAEWYGRDLLLPFASAALAMVPVRLLAPLGLSPELGFLAAGLAGAIGLGVTGLQIPQARALLGRIFRNKRADPAATGAVAK